MPTDLDLMLGVASPALEWEQEEETRRAGNRLHEVGFLTVWELQSQVATVASVTFVALLPIWTALICMLCWSLVATLVYCRARRKGLPDLLDTRWGMPSPSLGGIRSWLSATGVSLLKTWFAGLQPFLYARVFCPVLLRPATSWRGKAIHWLVLAVGFALFGVTTVHHLLERAGTPKEKMLRLCLVGPFLNVPYRIVASALVLNFILQVARPVSV